MRARSQVRGSGLVALVLAVALTLTVTLAGCVGADQSGSPIEAPGVEKTVQLLAPSSSGAGKIPTFEWSAVEGAGAYRLVVQNDEGDATWTWEGPGTSIVLGAVPDREEGDGGPILTAGSSWSVVALDDDGHVLAVSALRPVSP